MIKFISISSFRKRLESLCKIKRGVYSGVKVEICRAFEGIPIDQIRSNRDMILIDNDSIIIKLRLPDKNQRLSKADGYRLIYMVMKQLPIVVFLDIYPKRGPLQQLDIEDNDLQLLLHQFVEEMNSNQIVQHDISNNLHS